MSRWFEMAPHIDPPDGRAVGSKDVSNLQLRARRRPCPARRPSISKLGQQRAAAVGVTDQPGGEMSIKCCRAQLGMSRQNLNDPHVRSRLQAVGGEAVAQHVPCARGFLIPTICVAAPNAGELSGQLRHSAKEYIGNELSQKEWSATHVPCAYRRRGETRCVRAIPSKWRPTWDGEKNSRAFAMICSTVLSAATTTSMAIGHRSVSSLLAIHIRRSPFISSDT